MAASLEKQLRSAWDRARQILTNIEAARDHHAAVQEHLVGFEVGCALGALHLLEGELLNMAQDHFYGESDDDG